MEGMLYGIQAVATDPFPAGWTVASVTDQIGAALANPLVSFVVILGISLPIALKLVRTVRRATGGR